ncbi:hypothetical protein JCM6882_007247 [Rhodosporidiobolus microsporus]
MASATTTICYGVAVRTSSLLTAVEAFPHLQKSLSSFDLVSLRIKRGELKAESRAVERVPQEVWDQVKKEVVSEVLKAVSDSLFGMPEWLTAKARHTPECSSDEDSEEECFEMDEGDQQEWMWKLQRELYEKLWRDKRVHKGLKALLAHYKLCLGLSQPVRSDDSLDALVQLPTVNIPSNARDRFLSFAKAFDVDVFSVLEWQKPLGKDGNKGKSSGREVMKEFKVVKPADIQPGWMVFSSCSPMW